MAKKDKWLWAGLAGAVVVALLVLPPLLTDNTGDFWSGMAGLAMIFAMILGYFIPTIIAVKRKHRSTGGIVALNILTGWTFIGWVASLVWSLSSAQQPVVVQQFVAPQAVQYQVGDVVNGHRFNGQSWEPVQ